MLKIHTFEKNIEFDCCVESLSFVSVNLCMVLCDTVVYIYLLQHLTWQKLMSSVKQGFSCHVWCVSEELLCTRRLRVEIDSIEVSC